MLIVYWKQCFNLKAEGSGRQGENSDVVCLQQGTCGRFTTITENHRTVSSGLFLRSLEARFEWSITRVALTRERRQPCNALFSLSVVLNRNTLRRRPYG